MLPLHLEDYAAMCTDEELTDSARYRVLMHQLPRRFHGLPAADQTATLADPPPLTNTRWDAFLAAVVEHVARLHGHPLPTWLDEPSRFLDPPWVISRNRAIAADSVHYSPPAFQRHGALPDPLDLDPRGGELYEWLPGSWAWPQP